MDDDEIEYMKEYLKSKINFNSIDFIRTSKSNSYNIIFGTDENKEPVYEAIILYLSNIIFSPKLDTTKKYAKEISPYIDIASKNIEDLDLEFFNKIDRLTEELSIEDIEKIEIKKIEELPLKYSEKSCESMSDRKSMSLYSFAPARKVDKNFTRSSKSISSKEFKSLKYLCKTKDPAHMYSFVSSVISKYSDKDQNGRISEEDLKNYFASSGSMPISLSNFIVKYFGNEFYRPLSMISQENSPMALNVASDDILDSDEEEVKMFLRQQLSEQFPNPDRLARNLMTIFLGWNIEEGIFFDVSESLVHVSKENSRTSFENIKTKVGFVCTFVIKKIYDQELDYDIDQEEIAEFLKYYVDYYKGNYSKDFLDKLKVMKSKVSVDDITMIKTIDNLAKQDKSEQEIAIDISDFCKTIESINKARKNEGLKAYKDKDLFGTQKYKKFLVNTKANISKAIKSICDSNDRTLASVAGILFKPKEVNFNAFLQKSFIAGFTEKQFTGSLKKLFEEFDIEKESLQYLSKNNTDLKTDQYYKALAQKILEKMDPRLILGTIVQSAFYDKDILDKDNDEEYEIVFSDDVIPVSRENFTEQLNMLAEFANESINELMGGETIETTELKPDSEEAAVEEVSLAKKIENEIKSQTTDEGLETIFADINLYKDQDKITSGEFVNLKQMIENKGFEIARKQVSKKQNKKMKLKPSAIKKKKSDFYLKIISYANVFDEDADDFSKNGKVFSFAIAIDSLNDLLIYLKGRDFEDVAEEVGFDFVDEDELLLSDSEFEELNSEIKNIIKKVQEEEDKYYLQKESVELNEISDVDDVELLSKKILRGQFKDIYLFENADKEGLRREGEPMIADKKFENGSAYIYPLTGGGEVLLGIYTDERKFVKELRDSKYIRILDIIEN
jgi:hypothetical protein